MAVLKIMARLSFLASALLLVACDNSAQSDTQPSANAAFEVETYSLGVITDLVNLPWIAANRQGLFDSITRREGIRLEILEFSEEADALEAYEAGQVDAVTANLNALLSNAAVVRTNTTIPLIFGFSRGDYGIFSRRARNINELAGERVNLRFGSSAHYLLFRILELNQQSTSSLELIDSSQEELVEGFLEGTIDSLAASGSSYAQISQLSDANLIADSRSLYGEMMAALLIRAEEIADNPALATALVEGWFLAMETYYPVDGPLSETTVREFSQLTSHSRDRLEVYLAAHNFLRSPEHALQYIEGQNLSAAIEGSRRFIADNNANSCGPAGVSGCSIEFDGKTIITGNATRFTFDTETLHGLAGD